MPINRIIGIDFGTSTTVVKIHNDNGPKCGTFTLSVDGREEIPTIVFKRNEDGVYFFATEALNEINNETEGETFRNFKLNFIDNDPAKKKLAIGLTTRFLNYLHQKYKENCPNEYGDCDSTKVYVSYPLKWPLLARREMLNCAINAGFGDVNNVYGRDEPTAAAVASFQEKQIELRRVGRLTINNTYKAMLMDMGAGTTDIVLFNYKINDGNVKIDKLVTYPTADSPLLCGGREIDESLSILCTEYCQTIPADEHTPPGILKKCNSEVKPWKEQILSPTLLNAKGKTGCPEFISTFIQIYNDHDIVNPNLQKFEIGRSEFETLTNEHWENWVTMIANAFKEGKEQEYSPENIDVIILTGGHSQWYIVREFFEGSQFGNLEQLVFNKISAVPECLIQSGHPSQTVADGLCRMDEYIAPSMPLANNIWIQFEYEGKLSDNIIVCQKGQILPFTCTIENEINDSIKGNFLRRREFAFKCIVREGSNIETAKKYEQEATSPVSWDLFSCIVAGLLGPFVVFGRLLRDIFLGDINIDHYADLFEAYYSIRIGANIEISEDGKVNVSPQIYVDNKALEMKSIKF